MVTRNILSSAMLEASQVRINTVLADREVRDEIANLAHAGSLTHLRALVGSTKAIAEQLDRAPNAAADGSFFSTREISEAIVMLRARPVLFIKAGIYDKAELPKIEKVIAPFRTKLVKPISSIGRIELLDHDDLEWVGTGWRVDDDLIVTNRHVASAFAQRQGTLFRFKINRRGQFVKAVIDFREEYRVPDNQEVGIAEVVWMAPDVDTAPDMAVLRVVKGAEGLPTQLTLAKKDPEGQQDVAVVGYPAKDGQRNDPDAMRDIFDDIYDVKRFAPGKVDTVPKGEWFFTHDCTTLGGNSGSAVLSLSTGEVAGLHFGGSFKRANFAVKASVIRGILKRKTWIPVSKKELHVSEEQFSERKRKVGDLSERDGFDEEFLGLSAPIPKPGASHKVPKAGDAMRLDYMHFSIVMSSERRFAIVTAVNIDGALKRKLKRKDTWGFDPRAPKETQVGHAEFYGPAAFDKGHMVRREDPGWGESEDEARQGEDDSFVYTNAVPQMPQLNQHTWLSLEDYVLSHAKTEGFKISVFTGPIFRESDPDYLGVKVPIDFYKVVAMRDADDKELVVSAYILSQEGMMPTEGFRYGPFKTYQVPVRKVEAEADIRFTPTVRHADVFEGKVGTESLESARFIEITGPADVVLTKSSY